MKKQKIVVLTGAGISAESGISTFRDSNGLWENHKIEEVASPEGWAANPRLVLDFYNKRRAQLFKVAPNKGHLALAALEKKHEVHIITQNVDDLHERAGSTRVLHLHGELRKVRSDSHPHLVYQWDKDLHLGECCERGAQLRPHIVWFGEEVPMMAPAADLAEEADVFMVVGTSLQVYPAAGLVAYARRDIPVCYVDPRPQLNIEMSMMKNLTVIAEPASVGVPRAIEQLGLG